MSGRPLRTPVGKGGSEGEQGSPAWMVTYSDMVTLLLCFFVLLFSFSEIDVQRFRSILAAFQGSVGVLEGGLRVVLDDDAVQGRTDWDLQDVSFYRPELEAQLQEVYARAQAFLWERSLGGNVELVLDERGVIVRFAEGVLFDLGKADLKPEAIRVLASMAEFLRSVPNPIRVEGHTDNWPINNEEFPSNWELSTARATTVIRHLIEEHGLSPQKLSAAGYGEYRPVVDNDTPENRARNRRVDIVLLRLDLEE
ncbi:MAG: OmpA family protein [Firmicutes bacterium]|nr:OmpA family protein [Bacillota bacterium]